MPNRFSRREFLQIGGAGALAATSAVALGACGSSSSSSTTTTSTASLKPKRGGTLHYGGTGGTDSDTLDAQNGLNQQDFSRIPLLFEPLVTIGATGKLEYVLAESITANAAATEWTIKVRPDVLTHDGKPFGAR